MIPCHLLLRDCSNAYFAIPMFKRFLYALIFLPPSTNIYYLDLLRNWSIIDLSCCFSGHTGPLILLSHPATYGLWSVGSHGRES